jgi:hypothetical protein
MNTPKSTIKIMKTELQKEQARHRKAEKIIRQRAKGILESTEESAPYLAVTLDAAKDLAIAEKVTYHHFCDDLVDAFRERERHPQLSYLIFETATGKLAKKPLDLTPSWMRSRKP